MWLVTTSHGIVSALGTVDCKKNSREQQTANKKYICPCINVFFIWVFTEKIGILKHPYKQKLVSVNI